MQVIGITGMSGAGKTIVSKKICDLKEAEHINADRIVRDCQRQGEEYYENIVQAFGREILLVNRRH